MSRHLPRPNARLTAILAVLVFVGMIVLSALLTSCVPGRMPNYRVEQRGEGARQGQLLLWDKANGGRLWYKVPAKAYSRCKVGDRYVIELRTDTWMKCA